MNPDMGVRQRAVILKSRLAIVAVALAVGLVAATSGSADQLPPPPGWPQAIWDTLSPDDQQIERDMSPPPITDLAAVIKAKKEWVATHSDEQIADQLVADAKADGYVEETSPELGIQGAQQNFGRGTWSFEHVWVGLTPDRRTEIQAYAGSLVADPTVGIVLVEKAPMSGDFHITSSNVYPYPGHGGGFDIESESRNVLTLSRWIGDAKQSEVVRFDLGTRTFRD